MIHDGTTYDLWSEKYTLGRIIHRFRKENNISAKRFIDLVGNRISKTYLHRIEKKGEIPSPELICRISLVVGYKTETLLEIAKDEKLFVYSQRLDKKYKKALDSYNKNKEEKQWNIKK